MNNIINNLDIAKFTSIVAITPTTITMVTTTRKLSDTYKKLGIDFTFPIEIKNAEGNQTYYEDSNGSWNKREYDANGNETYYETSNGYWRKREYSANGKETYYENSRGYWWKNEYDASGNETYYETSNGYWSKRECDVKGKETYFEDSDGYWRKREYDAKGNDIYYESSDGCKEGTPLSQSCDGKVIEVDGKKYKLTEL